MTTLHEALSISTVYKELIGGVQNPRAYLTGHPELFVGFIRKLLFEAYQQAIVQAYLGGIGFSTHSRLFCLSNLYMCVSFQIHNFYYSQSFSHKEEFCHAGLMGEVLSRITVLLTA
ncbi:hypothetical protein JVU11DRAFT_8079 [Chiua virens]|nr:hypothetical protein JVU11DRAFT_8079 [Chiua virens]